MQVGSGCHMDVTDMDVLHWVDLNMFLLSDKILTKKLWHNTAMVCVCVICQGTPQITATLLSKNLTDLDDLSYKYARIYK